MTKTTNYQLPKWEKTDRVQMKDFNDMTATLDEALHGLAVSAEAAQAAADSEAAARAAAITALENKSIFVKLKETTVTQTAWSASVDVSDIDWSKWQYIFVDCSCPVESVTSNYMLRANSESGEIITTFPGGQGIAPPPRAVLSVGKMPLRMAAKNVAYQSLTSLVYAGAVYNEGGTITVWGIK